MKLSVILAAALAVSTAHAQAQTKVKIGLSTPISALQAYYTYGLQLGFYQEEGLVPEFVSVAGASILFPQLASKAVDFANGNPDLPAIAIDKGEPYPVRFVFNQYTTQLFEFAVLEDSPVRTLADLKGKRIGVGALSWSNLPMSRAMLQDAGLKWNADVQVVPVGLGPAAWNRLSGRSIDALNLWSAQHELMALSGVKMRRLPLPEKYKALFSNGFAAHEDTIRDKPELVEKFGRVLAKSLYACTLNIEACVKSFWAYDPTARPAADKEAAWVAQYVAATGAELATAVGAVDPRRWGDYKAESWKSVLSIMAEGEQIKRADLPLDKLYTTRFVDGFNRWDRAAVAAKASAK